MTETFTLLEVSSSKMKSQAWAARVNLKKSSRLWINRFNKKEAIFSKSDFILIHFNNKAETLLESIFEFYTKLK